MNTWLVLLVAAVPLLIVWVSALVELFRRSDLGAGRTALWGVALLLVPVVGLAAYVLVRPPRVRRFQRAVDPEPAAAAAVVLVAERHRRGELSDDEYLAEIAAITG